MVIVAYYGIENPATKPRLSFEPSSNNSLPGPVKLAGTDSVIATRSNVAFPQVKHIHFI
jgi:hypothetical protein